MLAPAVTGAPAVPAAVGDALIPPFCTDEIRQRLGVLREVGGEAVGADAGVGEGGGFAVVLIGDAGGGLEADSDGRRTVSGLLSSCLAVASVVMLCLRVPQTRGIVYAV